MTRMSPDRFFAIVVAAAGYVSPVVFLQCSVEDESAGAKPAASANAADGSGDGAPAASEDGGAVVPGLCTKVGGAEVVHAISDQILALAGADCRIGAYFSAMSAETATHVKECMRRELGDMFDCPGSTYAGFVSSTGRACRSLAEAHANLVGADGRIGLNAQDALAYMQSAQTALKSSGLSDADATKVLALFRAVEPAVAQRISAPTERNTSCTCPGGAFNGEACTPDGGYVRVDAGKDAAPSDSGPKDGAPADAASDTGPSDAAKD